MAYEYQVEYDLSSSVSKGKSIKCHDVYEFSSDAEFINWYESVLKEHIIPKSCKVRKREVTSWETLNV